MNTLPADIEVLEPLAGAVRETRYRLPPSTQAAVKRLFQRSLASTLCVLILPALFIGVSTAAIANDDPKQLWIVGVVTGLVFVIFVLPVAAYFFRACWRCWGRQEILCSPGKLSTRSQFGLFWRTRRFLLPDFQGFQGFRVQVGSLQVDTLFGPSPFEEHSQDRDVGTLFADYDRGQTRLICSGYEPDWLTSLAQELTRRCELAPQITLSSEDPEIIEPRQQQPSTSDAQVRQAGDTLIIEHPPRGWRRAVPLPGLVMIGVWNSFACFYSATLFAGQVHWEGSDTVVPIWLGLLLGSPFYAIGIGGLAVWYAHARYAARWEVNSKELRFWDRMFFGEATAIWPRSELQSIRVVSRHTDYDKVAWITTLQIAAADRPVKEFFRGREKSELEWLATTLNKALGLPQ